MKNLKRIKHSLADNGINTRLARLSRLVPAVPTVETKVMLAGKTVRVWQPHTSTWRNGTDPKGLLIADVAAPMVILTRANPATPEWDKLAEYSI